MNTYYKILNEIAASFDMDQWDNQVNVFINPIKSYIEWPTYKEYKEFIDKLNKFYNPRDWVDITKVDETCIDVLQVMLIKIFSNFKGFENYIIACCKKASEHKLGGLSWKGYYFKSRSYKLDEILEQTLQELYNINIDNFFISQNWKSLLSSDLMKSAELSIDLDKDYLPKSTIDGKGKNAQDLLYFIEKYIKDAVIYYFGSHGEYWANEYHE